MLWHESGIIQVQTEAPECLHEQIYIIYFGPADGIILIACVRIVLDLLPNKREAKPTDIVSERSSVKEEEISSSKQQKTEKKENRHKHTDRESNMYVERKIMDAN